MQRIHGLDATRAIMMMLGVVLHMGLSYITAPPGNTWPLRDGASSPIMDMLIFFIHTFRMPVFFVIAGFFSHFLWSYRGAKAFAENRVKRIVIPFLVSWIFLYPAVKYSMNYGVTGTFELANGLLNFGLQTPGVLVHLWFLYFLILIYAVSLLFIKFEDMLEPLRAKTLQVFDSLITSPLRVLWFAFPTFFLLLPHGYLFTSTSIVPEIATFGTYGFFFLFGCLLFARKEHIKVFDEKVGLNLLLGFVFLVPNLMAIVKLKSEGIDTFALKSIAALTGSLLTWFFIFGIIGLLNRVFSRENKVIRYLVDASYWIYLIHLPICLLFASLLKPVEMSLWFKFFIGVAGTYFLTIGSYQLFVRYTIIGEYLHGRKQRPSPSTEAVVVPGSVKA